jgi:hypothetical protein
LEEVDVWPEELVYALARYCEEHSDSDDSDEHGSGGGSSIRLHVFPFGGLPKALAMIHDLTEGRWPPPPPPPPYVGSFI